MTDHQEKRIVYRRVVDLSHPIRPGIPLWPGDPVVEFETVAETGRDGYFLRRFSMGEHGGTHLSSPATLYDAAAGPDELPAPRLVVPAIVINVSAQTAENPDYVLTPGDVAKWERRYGPVPPGSLALLSTGWQRHWYDPDRFINADADGRMHTPGFGPEAARLLLERRNVAGLGIDAHGVDAGMDANLSVSRLALARSALVLECLNNLDQLPPTGTTVIVGRLPLVGGSGSPASVLALTQ
ncbi:MAG: cyclase family protein [Chloroflexi bacterium]|nr:cyclase family protein [Chloroflexota bacterium]MYD48603.1 cyclase family protein [Chloroflexota bacterium]